MGEEKGRNKGRGQKIQEMLELIKLYMCTRTDPSGTSLTTFSYSLGAFPKVLFSFASQEMTHTRQHLTLDVSLVSQFLQ